MLKIPNYQIHIKIHESANSQVYRGIKESDNLPVICKILPKDYPTPEEITRYKLEHKITSSLSIPDIVKSYDFQQLQNNFVIIFEDFGGESLDKILSTSKFTLKDLLALAIQITRILSEIHAANIIHKDINPSNIVINLDTKQLKIIDFGIATSLSRETLTLTNPRILEGTLAYISPEQTGRMNRSLDYRTDFYSFGAMVYFYLEQNRIEIAKTYLQDARYCYLPWGAKAKVEDVENRYPQLLQLRSEITEKHKVNTTQSATTKLEAFDLETVLKASQAIASEILLDRLLTKLMTILIENAGAQTGYLILPTQEEWQIAAIGSINNAKVELIAADSMTTLPTSLINYVARTQKSVVLNHAIQEGNFQSEPWIIQHNSKSILCTPLLNQRKLTGIVLLENNLTTKAFTSKRIEIINLLSTQAAISINNAQLLKQQEELNQSLRAEIDEREKAEQELIRAETTLQSLVSGTAAVTGQDFFPALVSHIARALHVPYVLVTELVNGELKALGYWADGALQPEISFFPARRPCEFALKDGLFLCETLVQQMFPEDLDLVAMQADSYLGISLKNANGDPIGNLCILDLKPLSDIERIKTILDVFAARAAAELERKRANEALHHLNEELEVRVIQRTAQLEAANKALESFSYSVSHDLRAPLRAIDGFARMMKEDYSEQLDAEGNRYLKVVRDNAKRMGELIDDLLNLSRMDRKGISKQPIVVNDLIQQVLSDLIPENRQIEFEIADLPICQADLSLITQVWINLLSNAIKYTGYKSVAQIQVGYELINSEEVYFIKDNGSGFDMEYANNLFGVFQRLHREQEFEGTGIGLAIVQRIIQRHGGRIWAEAAVNRGATFYFTLPK